MSNGTTDSIITQGIVPLIGVVALTETIRAIRQPRRRLRRSFDWLG